MRLGNIGVGILIAACGAAAIAVGIVVQNRIEKNNAGTPRADIPDVVSTENYEKWIPVLEGDDNAGDINSDGVVNTLDFSVLRSYVNDNGSVSINTVNSDLNQDGVTDEEDLYILEALLMRGRNIG